MHILPIEWFFLFYFILALVFRIFFIGGHIVLVSIGAMCVANAIVFYTVPFSFTAPFATGVAFGLMVSLIHGLNLKGVILAMTMYMLKPYLERQTLISALNPPSVPSIVFLAPLAAFCSAFGVLWLLYDLFGYLHASTDSLRGFFGLTLPTPSIVTLKDVKDRSITLNWQCSAQATVSKHLIEIDGLIIGESGKQETSVVIQGLYPDNTYRIRLWAITTRNWKSPSDYVVVRTLPSVPVELELSSVENARKESELQVKQNKEEAQQTQHESVDQQQPQTVGSNGQGPNDTDNNDETQEVGSSTVSRDVEKYIEPSRSDKTTPLSTTAASGNSLSAAVTPLITAESPEFPELTAGSVTEDQIAALRVELEAKETAHSFLNQQLVDLERQYKHQEETLRCEITALRQQQKQEDEPRQQAKAKLKELQESLREAEANKSKIEKEHKLEVDKRQRIMEQLESKRKRLEQLQKNLSASEERLRTEKENHRQQKKALEAALAKLAEDVKAAESSTKNLKEEQKELCSTIETKEKELSKLQATLQSPKGPHILEQKNRELGAKCAHLTEQLSQFKTENQQLQERLAEVTKNVAQTRSAQETRKAQMAIKASKSTERQDDLLGSANAIGSTVERHSLDQGSRWTGSAWGHGKGTKLIGSLFQDEVGSQDARTSLLGPPPGLALKGGVPEFGLSSEAGMNQDRLDGNMFQSSTALMSVTESGSSALTATTASGAPFKRPNHNASARARSSPKMSSEYIFADNSTTGAGSNRFGHSTKESPLLTESDGADLFGGSRSRSSSISTLGGFQSPSFTLPTSQLPDQGLLTAAQQQRQSSQRPPQPAQGHSMSPRTRLYGALHSPPVSHVHSPWGTTPGKSKPSPASSAAVAGPIGSNAFGVTGRSPRYDGENKAPQQSNYHGGLSYHQLFGSSTGVDPALGLLHDGNSPGERQVNEQHVIKSMFESPDTLDFHHHLRSVGSHSTLTTQAKILPSHLRSISTPSTSSPLSSPTLATIPPPFPSSSTSSPSSSSPWDLRPIARPSGSLGRLHSHAEGSSLSLNMSDTSSPTSPHSHSSNPAQSSTNTTAASTSAGGRKPSYLRDSKDRGVWGVYGSSSSDIRTRSQESLEYSPLSSFNHLSEGGASGGIVGMTSAVGDDFRTTATSLGWRSGTEPSPYDAAITAAASHWGAPVDSRPRSVRLSSGGSMNGRDSFSGMDMGFGGSGTGFSGPMDGGATSATYSSMSTLSLDSGLGALNMETLAFPTPYFGGSTRHGHGSHGSPVGVGYGSGGLHGSVGMNGNGSVPSTMSTSSLSGLGEMHHLHQHHQHQHHHSGSNGSNGSVGLVSGGFESTTTPGSTAMSDARRKFDSSSLSSSSSSNSSAEVSSFGYGLKLNPFGWTIPTDVDADADQGQGQGQNQDHSQQDKA
ncbi:hypothetical protein BGW38_010683 [Lunasporangiospora selenospora]|uniref:Fibronectin type-III domain-containing protein n=1 Tax=Lunasporangiospora selenospora TaxID=979761 RepID=A0A9P6KFK1_9FUNG|nr:hypothetical protein BGW38_010683 [Lunasporangiospora selenospora]